MTFVIVATEENKDSVINMLVASHNEIWYHRTFHYVPTPRIMKYTGHSEHSITYQHRELWNIPDIQNIPLRTNTENYEIYRTFRTFHYVPTPRIMKSTGHSEHSITCQHRELWNIPDILNLNLAWKRVRDSTQRTIRISHGEKASSTSWWYQRFLSRCRRNLRTSGT